MEKKEKMSNAIIKRRDFLYDKINENISYQQYSKLQDAISFSELPMSLITLWSIYQGFAKKDPESLIVGGVTLVATLGATSYAKYSKKNKGYLKIGEVQSAIKLYDKFLDHYANHVQGLGLKEGVAIGTAFSEWLKKGYLSKDRKFGVGFQQDFDIEELLGANILTGSTEQEHVATLLRDILNKSDDIKAHTVTLKRVDRKNFPDHDGSETLYDKSLAHGIKYNHRNFLTLINQGTESFLFEPLTGKTYYKTPESQVYVGDDDNGVIDGILDDIRIVSSTITDNEAHNSLEVSTLNFQKILERGNMATKVSRDSEHLIAHLSDELHADFEEMETTRETLTGDYSKVKEPDYARKV